MRVKALLLVAVGSLLVFSCENKKEEKVQAPPKEEVAVKKEEAKPKGEAYSLADSKGCFACHDVQKKKVGPAYVEVAKRYADKEGALEELVRSITKGSMGKWSSIPMTPQPVTKEEAKKLAEWILSLK